jgi:hypothetical protein
LECGSRLVEAVQNGNTSPVHVDSDVESISDAELFNDAWRLQVAKNTAKFYDSPKLKLPLDELRKRTGENAIEQCVIVIAGSPGSGKDAKTDSIVNHVFTEYSVKKCPKCHSWVSKTRQGWVHCERKLPPNAEVKSRDFVSFQEVSAENFRAILDADSWPHKPITTLGLQDCTNVNFKEDPDVRDFWRIRHKTKEKTGLSQGLVLLILTCHSWFRLQKEFRTEPDLVLISDLPKDQYDRREYCRRFIPGEKDQERLRRIELKTTAAPSWRGFAYAVGIGFIYLPEVPPITPDRTYEAAPAIIPKPTIEPKSTPEPIQEEEERYTGSLAMRFKRIAVATVLVMLVTAAGWIYIDNNASLTPYLFLFLAVVVLVGSRKTLWPPKKT